MESRFPRCQNCSNNFKPLKKVTAPDLLTDFTEHELLLVLLQELRGARLVQEQRVDSLDVVHLHFCTLQHGMEMSSKRRPHDQNDITSCKTTTQKPTCMYAHKTKPQNTFVPCYMSCECQAKAGRLIGIKNHFLKMHTKQNPTTLCTLPQIVRILVEKGFVVGVTNPESKIIWKEFLNSMYSHTT